MRKTTNYGLALYDKEDKMNITSEENSLNHNMELIDSALKEKATETFVTNKIAEAKLEGSDVSEEIQVSSTMPTSGSVMLWYEIEGNSTVDLNNFFLENNENDLIINYQDDLDLNFEVVNNELIVNNGVSDLDFTINEKKEMEVSYE
jgi:hypothetical protein